MEKLVAGDKVRLKRSIFTNHIHLGEVGVIATVVGEVTLVGTIFVKWPDGSGEWMYASWLERV